ncbi:MAG: CapA family protein, partial [Lentisphaerae bacterium]|nr:CapA family protein [Lentisphaerota bacterium]
MTDLLFRKSSEEIAASLIVAGDWAPIRAFEPIMAGEPEAIYGDLLPILRSADLRVVNVEAPLSGGTPAVK